MLDRLPLSGSDPPRQPGRGRGRQAQHRREQLARHVGALAVQPGQEILPGQLRRRDSGQQLPSAKPAIPLLDGADRGIHRFDHAEPAAQLADRGQPAFAVSAASGVPTRGCCRFLPRILTTR